MKKSPGIKPPLKLMVSSTVYGIEELLDQVYSLLTNFGYEVWASHKGTVTVYPHMTAFGSCLKAVEDCDLFVSIITPQYGTGVDGSELSITHQELLTAIQLNKPRWVMAHDHVVFARALLRKFGWRDAASRTEGLSKLGFNDKKSMDQLKRTEGKVIDDLRVIDMYDAAARHDITVLKDRQGNWVQKFSRPEDVRLYAATQFSRYQQVERFLEEQFRDSKAIRSQVDRGAK